MCRKKIGKTKEILLTVAVKNLEHKSTKKKNYMRTWNKGTRILLKRKIQAYKTYFSKQMCG
jgi:hypothetical protein